MAAVEDITGHTFEEPQPRGKYLAAITYVVMKRSNPDATLEDAYNMSVEEAGALIEPFLTTDEDPKE